MRTITLDEALTRRFDHDAIAIKRAVARQATVGTWQRAIKRKIKHKLYLCIGGPYDGHSLDLSGPSTGVFTVNGVTGQYTLQGRYDTSKTLYWKEIK